MYTIPTCLPVQASICCRRCILLRMPMNLLPHALATLRRLGANGAAAAFGRAREAAGARRLRGPRRSTLSHPAGLTRREQEVLESMATGASNPAIAQRLQLSERTVAHHVSAIRGKLGAANRVGAIEQARRAGLLAKDGHPAREK